MESQIRTKFWILTIMTASLAGTIACGGDDPTEPLMRSVERWGTNFGGPGSDAANTIFVNADGSAFLGGEFHESMTAGNVILSSGIADGYVTRLDDTGLPLWAVGIGGTGHDRVMDITVGSGGNVIAVGSYTGTISVGGTSLTARGSQDVFVVKISGDGNVMWATSLGGPSSDGAAAVAVDDNDTIFVTGHFRDTLYISNGDSVISRGGIDMYVARLRRSGKPLWVRSFGNTDNVFVRDMAFAAPGELYLTGTYSGVLDFDGPAVTSNGENDAFLLRMDDAGNAILAATLGGAGYDIGTAVAAADDGSFAVAGSFEGSMAVGTQVLTSTVGSDVFIIKYNGPGPVQWAAQGACSSSITVTGLTFGLDGSLNICGTHSDRATFGSITIPNSGRRDIYTASCNSMGAWQWVWELGEGGDEDAHAIDVGTDGSVYTVGRYSRETRSGSVFLGPPDGSDAFVVKVPLEGP